MKKILLLLFSHFLFIALKSQCLSGTYTIGGTAPDFTTFAAATSALKTNGICGPVIFNIRDGIYKEQILLKTSITGLSKTNNIVFQSESGDSSKVELRCASDSVTRMADLENVQFITFSRLTFSPSTKTYERMINLSTNCSDITISNCRFIAPKTLFTTFTAAIGCYTPNNNQVIKNVNIINNRFEGGHYHIHFYLYVIPISQLQITGNVFINYEDLGILVVHPENITVSQNSFNSQLGGAIQIREAAKNLIIEKNKGIDPGGFTFINCIDSTFANRTISNNMISGLFLSKSSYIDIFNNSIYALSKNNIPALCFGLNKVDHINHKNNIYSTDNGVSINGDNVSNFISDHNDYYSNSFTIARWETKELSTLQDFINITKTDSNSFSVDPLFVSNTDLHLKTCLLLDGKGDSNTGITTDIDEEMRQSPPDVGADEYTVVPHLFDAGISDIQMLPQNCSDTISLSVRIKNFATDTLHSVTIKLNLNDSITVSYDWTGALGQETKKEWIFLGKFFIGIGDIKVKSWTIYPDAQPDSQPLNDTTTINFGYLPLHGSYTAGNPSCFFPTVEKAISELKKHGICAPVVIKIADGTYTDQEELSGINGSLINTITFESLNQDSSKVLFINQSNTISFYVTEGTFLFKKIGFINKDTTSTYGKPFFMRTAKVGIENCYFRSITNAASCIETDATMRLNISSNYFYTETPRYKAASIHLDKPLTGEAKPNVMITNNTFDESVFAIYSQAADSLIIYGNRMNTSKAASLKAGTGITISAAKTIEISNNRISGDYITAVEIAIPASYGSYTGMVKNNFINTKGGALKCKDMQRLYLYYNTMNMDASDTAFTMMTFINCRDIIFKNNIVNSTGANKLLEADTVKGFERDFNNYHSTHPRPFKVQGKSYLTLQDYQQNTMSDLNAHDYIPKFVSIVDLHLDKDPNLNGKGTPIAGITTDIDGDIRSITPDIGADEYDGSVTGIKETLNSVNTFNSYPNPFSDYITVSYALQEDARVQLTMYDVRGRLIHTLVNTKQSQGEHTFSVNVKAMELTDNVYFLKLETGNEVYFIKTFSVR